MLSSVPAAVCSLHLAHSNTTSVTVNWDGASGEFDFHRLTLVNALFTNTLIVPKEERVTTFTGLVDGCIYNVSAERVRGVTAGSAASLTVTTGRPYYKSSVLLSLGPVASFSDVFFLFSLSFMSAGPSAWLECRERVCTCILAALGPGSRLCRSLSGETATKPGKSHSAPCK